MKSIKLKDVFEKDMQKKKHIILSVLIFLLFVTVIGGGLLYHVLQKPVCDTEVLENVWRKSRAGTGSDTSSDEYVKKADDNDSNMEDYLTFVVGNNRAVFFDKKSRSKSGYVYDFYMVPDNEIQKSGIDKIKLIKCHENEKITGFLVAGLNGGDGFSPGKIYRIGGRESRKFIVYKDEADNMYIGKCVGYNPCLRLDKMTDSVVYTDKKTELRSMDEYLRFIMGIKTSDDIREIVLERYKGKSEKEPEKRIAVWTDGDSKKEIYDILTDKAHMKNYTKSTFQKRASVMAQNCYYLAAENRQHEMAVFGIVLNGNEAEMYVEPQYKSCTKIVLSKKSQNELIRLIKKLDK